MRLHSVFEFDASFFRCRSQKKIFPSRSNRHPESSEQLKWNTLKQFSKEHPMVAPPFLHKEQFKNLPRLTALMTFFHFPSNTSTSGLYSAQLSCTRACRAPRLKERSEPSRTWPPTLLQRLHSSGASGFLCRKRARGINRYIFDSRNKG